MMTNEKKENTVYFVPSVCRITTDAETAIALAANSIRDFNNRIARETISDPIAFKTGYGYTVKCIRANGRDFQRRVYACDNSTDKFRFDGVVLQAQRK